jgi:hypothetical protein
MEKVEKGIIFRAIVRDDCFKLQSS